MDKYHKIQSVYKRDPEDNYSTFLEGEFSEPEFDFLKNCTWVFREKVDGTNIRVLWDGENITFKGRQEKSEIPKHLQESLEEMFLNDEMIEKFNDKFGNTNTCLYGEGFGNKIQDIGDYYIEDNQSFVLFDIKINDWWLRREDVEKIADGLGIEIVPIIGEGTLEDMVQITKWGFPSNWGDFLAEGIVATPKIPVKSRDGSRIITKVKYFDFKYD